jgi:hypothetical protein
LHTQDHVINYNHEQTIAGTVDESYHLTIPHQMHITRAIHYLEQVQYLEKITFSLDCTSSDFTGILKTLAAIPGMQEIELTLPASELILHSMDMVWMQQVSEAFIACLEVTGRHWRLKRLTIPMEFVTALLLSHLATLPNLQFLKINYSPPPRSPHHQQQRQQFPVWSSHTIPAECPGYVFLAHLKFDPREYFRELSVLDLGAPLSEVSYTTLRRLFPTTYIR